jgi:hypothetical protein
VTESGRDCLEEKLAAVATNSRIMPILQEGAFCSGAMVGSVSAPSALVLFPWKEREKSKFTENVSNFFPGLE